MAATLRFTCEGYEFYGLVAFVFLWLLCPNLYFAALLVIFTRSMLRRSILSTVSKIRPQ